MLCALLLLLTLIHCWVQESYCSAQQPIAAHTVQPLDELEFQMCEYLLLRVPVSRMHQNILRHLFSPELHHLVSWVLSTLPPTITGFRNLLASFWHRPDVFFSEARLTALQGIICSIRRRCVSLWILLLFTGPIVWDCSCNCVCVCVRAYLPVMMCVYESDNYFLSATLCVERKTVSDWSCSCEIFAKVCVEKTSPINSVMS